MNDRRSPAHGTPRWVKLFGLAALALAVVIGAIVATGIGGPHGPGRHLVGGTATDGAKVPRP
jgi:hypothetical protein